MAAYDSNTTRMPNGVTNAAPWQTMAASGIPDPSWAHVYHNDFDTYAAGDWTVTSVGAGTQALTDFDGGALLVSNTGGAADANYMQLKNAGFKLVGGKAAFFKFAGQLSDILNDTFFCGLAQKGATTLASITDGIFISKDTAGTGALKLNSKIGNVNTSVLFPASAALVAATNFELGIMVDYLGNVAAFFNPTTGANPISAAAVAAGTSVRGRVATLAAPSLTAVLLTPSFGLLNASAATRTLTLDFLTVVRER